MAYSQTTVVLGGLIHVPILIAQFWMFDKRMSKVYLAQKAAQEQADKAAKAKADAEAAAKEKADKSAKAKAKAAAAAKAAKDKSADSEG